MICIGHRGARGVYPENTIQSIEYAIDCGAPWVEIDVRAHQGRLLVIHDDTLGRTTNGTGYVTDYSLLELRALDAGNGQSIPLLEEVIATVKQRAIINIELKDSTSTALVLRIIEQHIAKGWSYDGFLVSSFLHQDLQWLKHANPKIRIGALSAGVDIDDAEFAQSLAAYSINLCQESLNQKIIDDAHNRGLMVFVYTVNDTRDFIKLQHMKVDGIFTDYPEKLLKWLAR